MTEPEYTSATLRAAVENWQHHGMTMTALDYVLVHAAVMEKLEQQVANWERWWHEVWLPAATELELRRRQIAFAAQEDSDA